MIAVVADGLSFQLVAMIVTTVFGLLGIGAYVFNRRENRTASHDRDAAQSVECRFEHSNMLESLKVIAAALKQSNDTQVTMTETLRSMAQQQQQVATSLMALAKAINDHESRTIQLWTQLLASRKNHPSQETDYDPSKL